VTDQSLIPASPTEDEYVRQVTTAEPPALLSETDPFVLFGEWFSEAKTKEPNDPNAMALATVDASGLPDLRMVLLKGFDADGFVFFTNLDSAKGQELAANPKAALMFHWKSLRRQVRLRGSVTSVSDEEADAYFATRARPAQISKNGSPRSAFALVWARCPARRTGLASAWPRRPSNSGATGHSACTRDWYLIAPPAAGARAGCFLEERA
jgi:pyridoxamine 5'-phosphate oxidase